MIKYDIGIIGAGPAGFTAALLAADKGESVVLFEKHKIAVSERITEKRIFS